MGSEGFAAVLVYFAVIIGIGIWFFLKNLKYGDSEKQYFLGGRNMGGFVSALSAGASDMSAWVLMGLPGAIYLSGMGQVWISVGLCLGTAAAWIFVAPLLRRYSILAGDSITIPQFLTNRFQTRNKSIQVIAALVFMITYCVYAASSIYACGLVFNTVVGVNQGTAMLIATIIIVFYTFLGGFNAVCWTDFFQGLLMLGALLLTPIAAALIMQKTGSSAGADAIPAHYFSWFSSGKADWASLTDVLNGLGWGLGYFGMPHILIRYFAVKSEKEMRKSQIIGCSWIFIIILMAAVVGLMGRSCLGAPADSTEAQMVFIEMVRKVFAWFGAETGMVSTSLFLAGLLLSAILAASMSTADSQLLASSSSFASDMYKPLFRKNASDREMMWAGRIVVLAISMIAYLIAVSPSCKGIMALVSCAWAAFGSAFGPVILLALYWRRFTAKGAAAGMAVGFAADVLWYAGQHYLVCPPAILNLYEILPGFFCGGLAAVIVSLQDKKPAAEVYELFDRVRSKSQNSSEEGNRRCRNPLC